MVVVWQHNTTRATRLSLLLKRDRELEIRLIIPITTTVAPFDSFQFIAPKNLANTWIMSQEPAYEDVKPKLDLNISYDGSRMSLSLSFFLMLSFVPSSACGLLLPPSPFLRGLTRTIQPRNHRKSQGEYEVCKDFQGGAGASLLFFCSFGPWRFGVGRNNFRRNQARFLSLFTFSASFFRSCVLCSFPSSSFSPLFPSHSGFPPSLLPFPNPRCYLLASFPRTSFLPSFAPKKTVLNQSWTARRSAQNYHLNENYFGRILR